jgi:acetyltransferase-like isoleucine patch superfamily enzyme
MSAFFAKAAFRLRERLNFYCRVCPRILYWRLLGLKIGKGTSLSRIQVSWPHQVSFGAGCVLEPDSRFKFDGAYQPGPKLRFDDAVFIGAGCEFNIRAGLTVGKHCLIASQCYFVDHDHGFGSRHLPMAAQTDGAEAPIVLEEDVWIGAQVVVLKGVHVGKGAIIAAGSVLTRSVGAFEIWGGVPARKLRDRPL